MSGRGWRALRIGLTGPIGCGKSTVAGWLAAQGALVIDADRLARRIVEPGQPALEAVVAAFGEGVRASDGRLDRAALGRIVFADPVERARLEAITGPAVRPLIEEAFRDADASGVGTVVLEAIRLVEGGYVDAVDEVWLVTCDPEVQRQRMMERGLEPADAEARIRAQAGLVERVAPVATRVIDTSGTLDAAESRVAAALAEARRAAAGADRDPEGAPTGPASSAGPMPLA